MSIIFISDNFPPEINAPATRTFEHLSFWSKSGTSVKVITCFPNFPIGKIYPGYKNKLFSSEIINNIEVFRVWSFIAPNKGVFKRILDYLSFFFTSFIAGLFIKGDLLIATSPQFFTTFSAFLLSKIKRVPWVFEIRDLWPESIVAVGAIKNKFIISILEKIELYLYHDCDKIIVVTKSFKNHLIERGVSSKKIQYIPNGVIKDNLKPDKKNSKLKNQLNIRDQKVFGYVGTHGMAHKLDFIVNQSTFFPNYTFLFIGEGSEKNKLIKLAKSINATNCIFFDSVPKDKIREYLSIIDYAIINLKKSDTFKSVIPSKIFESAAMDIPILLGVQGESQSLIEKYNAGECFIPEDSKSFSYALKKILKNNYSKGSRELALDFDRKKLSHKMLKFILS